MCTLFIGKLGRHRRLCGWIMNKISKHTDNMLIYICGYLTSVFSYLSSIFCFYWKSQHFRLTKWAMPNYSYSIYLNSICGKHHLPLLERWKIIVVMLVNSWKMTLTFWRQSFIEWIVFRSVSKTQMVTEFFFFLVVVLIEIILMTQIVIVNTSYIQENLVWRNFAIWMGQVGVCVKERQKWENIKALDGLVDWLPTQEMNKHCH